MGAGQRPGRAHWSADISGDNFSERADMADMTKYTETNVRLAFSLCYSWNANRISTGSLRKPAVRGKQAEEVEE